MTIGRNDGRGSWARRALVLVIGVGLLGLAACAADPAPLNVIAVPGAGAATVSWDPPPGDNALSLVAYQVRPYIDGVPQPPVRFDSMTTKQTLMGLTSGITYTFTVTGINALGNETASSAASNAVAPHAALEVEAGGAHTCARLSTGRVRCWGSNQSGQLGNKNFFQSSVPVTALNVQNATSIGLGAVHSCATLTDGTVTCWGYNAEGQLGNGTRTSPTVPVTVSGVVDAIEVTAGYGGHHSCALLADGTVTCWGYNSNGQLGNGTWGSVEVVPVTVAGLAGAVQIAGGGGHSCALLEIGTVRCWGWNHYGQLGDGTTTDSPVPVAVLGVSDAVHITGGERHTCAVLRDGTTKCWGQITLEAGPVSGTVTGLSGAVSVAGGGAHTCAQLADGTAACWGSNAYGQLGNGMPDIHSSAAVAVSGLSGVNGIAAGGFHSCAPDVRGAVWCWGFNRNGELGNGTKTNSSTPVPVTGL